MATLRFKSDGGSIDGYPEWAGAYTSQAALVAALASGDKVLTDGDIIDGFPTISGIDNLTIECSLGPSGYTRIMGILPVAEGDITDEGGGIYSFAAASQPPTMAWNYQQDDTSGTVTGINTSKADIVQAYVDMPVDRPVIAAWYGHLPRNATFATTTPTEGRWGYTGGRVYVYPPGSPGSVAAVAASLGRGSTARGGFDLAGCDDPIIRGSPESKLEIVGFGNAGAQNGSVFTNGCLRVTLEDIVSYDPGYRSFNLEGNTGGSVTLGHRVRRCIACGDTIVGSTTNNPFVVYNQDGASAADVVLSDCAIIAYPWLGVDGAPILGSTSGDTPMSQAYKPGGFYTHAGAGNPPMGGITLERFSMISMCQPLNAKHSLSMFWVDECIAQIPTAVFDTWDQTDPDDWPLQFAGGVVYGTPGNHLNTCLRRMRIIVPKPQGNLANYHNSTVGKADWVLLSSSNTSIYYEACEILLRQKNTAAGGCWRSISATNGLYMDLCTVVYDCPSVSFDSDCIYMRASGLPGAVNTRFRQCVFAQIGTNSTQRQFLRRVGTAPTSGDDYPDLTYQGLEVEACWFYQCGTTLFYRGGSVSALGTSYADFINTGAGSPIDPTGFLITDPEFADFANDDISPLADGALDTTVLSPSLASLSGVIGLYGGVYSGLYGADQGGLSASGENTIALGSTIRPRNPYRNPRIRVY